MKARSLARLAVVVTTLLILGVAGVAASAAPAAGGEQLKPSVAGFAGAPPGRQAQLMAPECQLERAQLQCKRRAGGTWECACGPAAPAVRTQVLSLVLSADHGTWSPRRWFGLAAR